MAKRILLFKSLKPLQKMHNFASTLQVLLFSLITVYKKRNKCLNGSICQRFY